MNWPRAVYAVQARWRAIRAGRRAEDDLNEELTLHLAMQVQEYLRRGMSEAEATRRARLALGVDQTSEAVRDGRPFHSVEIIMRDVRYAFRLMRRAPAFSAIAILTVALGIGANTAIFSIVNGILLRPLPFADPERLVRIHLGNPAQGISDGSFSVPEIEDWRSRTRAFASIAAHQVFPMIVAEHGEPIEVQAAFFIGDLLGTLGASTLVGRPIQEDDVRQARPNVVISERLWRARFGGDPSVIGARLMLWTRSYTIVGVMPSAFRYPTRHIDVWGPYTVFTDQEVGPRIRNQRVVEALARLEPGVSVEAAQAEADVVAAQLASEFPGTNMGWSAAHVVPLHTSIVGRVDRALLVVLAVVAVILLIACVNLANLLLARGTARAHEMATRAALGAGRARLARQLLTESLVLGLVGGLLGLALAYWGTQTILALSADTLPRVEDVRTDLRVIGVGLMLSIATALLFGILPAMRAAHTDPHERIRAHHGATGSGRRVRDTLVVAEVGLAVVLLIGATLMARSFLELRAVEPGFDPDRVLAVTLQLNVASASGDIGNHILQRREQILDRIAALPGVVDAGSITYLPLEGRCNDTLQFSKLEDAALGEAGTLRAENCIVSPGYLRTMRIPLLRGEPLPESSPPGAPLPFQISEAAARRFWPDEDPIGQVVRANYGGRAIVVGIVGDVRQHGLGEDAPPVVYFHQRTAPRIITTMVVRTATDPVNLAEPIRAAIRAIDPNQPVRSIATLEEVMSESIARDRFFTVLFGVFGALALLLSAIGVYGVLAYSVEQRTREIGVRIALGAQVGDVLRMVIGNGMLLVFSGMVIGTLASLALSGLLASQLHGVSATDPTAFVVATILLGAVALLACYLPARRATRVQAVTAIRAE
jgi:predicted permease